MTPPWHCSPLLMGCDKTKRTQLFPLCVILPPLDKRQASLAIFALVPGEPQQDKDSPLEMAGSDCPTQLMLQTPMKSLRPQEEIPKHQTPYRL